MAKPPPTPPSSDISGANRDMRAGSPDGSHDDPAGAVQGAKEGSAARPDETAPPERGTGEGRDD
jgi:hypothetical protein